MYQLLSAESSTKRIVCWALCKTSVWEKIHNLSYWVCMARFWYCRGNIHLYKNSRLCLFEEFCSLGILAQTWKVLGAQPFSRSCTFHCHKIKSGQNKALGREWTQKPQNMGSGRCWHFQIFPSEALVTSPLWICTREEQLQAPGVSLTAASTPRWSPRE